MLNKQVALDAVDLDLDGSTCRSVMDTQRVSEGATRPAAQLFERAQCSACRTPNVVHACLETVKFFHHGEWNDHVATRESIQTSGIGDEHRRIKYDACRGDVRIEEIRLIHRVDVYVISVQRQQVWMVGASRWWMVVLSGMARLQSGGEFAIFPKNSFFGCARAIFLDFFEISFGSRFRYCPVNVSSPRRDAPLLRVASRCRISTMY
jgi:hypothetical protein